MFDASELTGKQWALSFALGLCASVLLSWLVFTYAQGMTGMIFPIFFAAWFGLPIAYRFISNKFLRAKGEATLPNLTQQDIAEATSKSGWHNAFLIGFGTGGAALLAYIISLKGGA